MSRYFKAEISENRQIDAGYNLLTFTPLSDVKEPEPGQFYMIGKCVGETMFPPQTPFYREVYDPLLKRPFSLFRKIHSGMQILYRIKGRGTMMLRDLKKGSAIDVLGPLGNPYPMPDKESIPIIVAGGIGIASVFSLAEMLQGNTYIFYGARTRSELLFLDELKEYAEEFFVSTDDGSYGKKGTIIDVLKSFLTRNPSLVTRYSIYACGPKPLFESLREVVRYKGIKTYISLEETMACGIGACLGCVTKTVNGHKCVCKDGPVFSMDEIIW